MKKFKNVFLLLMGLFFANCMIAQKAVNELTLRYNISIESSDNSNPAKPLTGAALTVYIKGMDSRTDMVSSLGTESNFYDAKTARGYILKEYSGQKLMITLTKDNWAQKNQFFQNLKFSIAEGEQTIAGFKCKKATAKLEDGKNFTVYYLADVQPVNKEYHNAFRQLPGIPVQYELESGKLKFTYTLTNIGYDNIPAVKFDVPKTGYRIMTFDENQQLKKG